MKKNILTSFFTPLCFLLVTNSALSQAALDVLAFGNPMQEAAHGIVDTLSDTYNGLYGNSARRFLPQSTPYYYGGEATFTMAVDSAQQNYFTVKMSGSEYNPTQANGRILLDCEGLEVGYRHGSDEDVFIDQSGAPIASGSFWYRTVPLPFNLTHGKTSVKIRLHSTGWFFFYGTIWQYNTYQQTLTAPTVGVYKAYTHTNAYVPLPASDVQGIFPSYTVAPKRNTNGEEALQTLKTNCNNRITNLLNGADYMVPYNNNNYNDVEYLAQSYFLSWTIGYNNPAIIQKVMNAIDSNCANYNRDSTLVNAWGGAYGRLGYAAFLIYAQISNRLDSTFNFGNGTKTRRQYWSTMFKASFDNGRLYRRTITNQDLECTMSMYGANMILQKIDIANSIPTSKALNYIYQAMGLAEWTGSESQSGVPTYPFGRGYYMMTTKGTSHEPGWVSQDCYGNLGGKFYEMFRMSGDSTILNRAVQHEKIHSYFRYPSTDAGGFKAILSEGAICWRNQSVPGAMHYNGGLWVPAASQDNALLGTLKQMVDDGQFFYDMLNDAGSSPIESRWLFLPDMYAQYKAMAPSSVLNPCTPGQPNYTVADEQNGIIAIKYNKENFFIMLYRRAYAINNLAKIHHITPYTQRIVEAAVPDTRFTPSGTYITMPYTPQDPTGGTPPDNPVSAYGGIQQPVPQLADGTTAVQNRAIANFYSLRYGSYFMGMNTTASQTYTLNVPAPFVGTQAVNLFTGAKVTMPASFTVSPSTTIAYYLDSTIAIPSDTFQTATPKTYYSQGSLDVATFSSWNTVATGGGTSPTSFATADTFIIQSGHSMTTSASWSDYGSGATMDIKTGATLTATNLVAVTNFILEKGASYIHNVTDTNAYPSNGSVTMLPGSSLRSIGKSSNVEIQKWANGGTAPVALPTIPSGWGNLKINVANLNGSWVQGGTLIVNGDLTIAQTGGGTNVFKLVSTGAISDSVKGNFYIQGGRFAVSQVTTGSYGSPYALIVSGNYQQTGGYFTLFDWCGNGDMGYLSVGGNMTVSGGYFLSSGFYSNGNTSSTTIANASTISGISTGMGVAGAGIANGVTVNGTPSGSTITITTNASGANGTALPLFAGTTFTGTTTSGSNQISSVSSTAGLSTGMKIGGANIPYGTTITAISGSTLSISQLAYNSGTVTLVPGTVTFTGDVYASGGNAQTNISCAGNFLLNGGAFGFSIATTLRTHGMQVGGDFTVAGGGTFVNPGNWGTNAGGVNILLYPGASSTSSLTLPNTSTANSNILWTVATGKTINLGSNIGMGKYFAVAGTLNMGSYSFSGGTLNVLSSNGFNFTGTLNTNNTNNIAAYSAVNNIAIGMPVTFSTAGLLFPNTVITQISSTQMGISPASVTATSYTGTFTVAPFAGTVTTAATGTFPALLGASTRNIYSGTNYGFNSSSAQTIGSFSSIKTNAYGGVTSGSNTVTLNTANSNIAVGQTITGTGIPGSTTVTAYDGNVTLTLSANATATNSNLSFSFLDAVPTISTLALSGNKTVTLSAAVKVADTTTLTSATDILNLNGNTLTLGNTGKAHTIRGNGFLQGSTTSSLSLLGTGITGNIPFTSNLNVNNLMVNLPSGAAILGTNLTVNGVLTLTNGKVATGSNNLIMATAGSVTRTNGWVNGYLRKNVATGTNVARSFEIGDTGNYTPVSLTFASVTTAGDLLVSTTTPATAEPHYASFPLSKSKYLNRYWTLVNANTLAFTNYNGTFNYISADSIAGTNTSSLLGSIYSSSWSTGVAATAGTQSETISSRTVLGNVLFAECVGPTLFSLTGGGSSCTAGTAFPIGLSGSQSTVNYQLQNNGTNQGSPIAGTGAAIGFGSLTTAGTYTVIATASGGCSTTMTGYDTIVYPASVTPSVSVAASPATTICAGTSVTFTATPINGGTAPVYQWKKNGSNVGSGGTTYTDTTLNNGDIIVCQMTANNACQTASTANSPNTTITILSKTSSTTNVGVFYGSGYTFNGTTYYLPGTYTYHLTNESGCDSAATLVLSIIPQTYTWKGGTSGSYTSATNWNPSRNNVSASDTLLFDGNNINGSGGTGTVTVSNMATETIAKLMFQNSPTVNFSTNNAKLTINVELALNGTMNDGGNVISLLGNITGNGTHTGFGRIELPSITSIDSGVTLGNLFLVNSNSIIVNGSFAISNDLRVYRPNGTIFNMGVNTTITIGGNIFNNSGNVVTMSNTGKISMTGTSTQSGIMTMAVSSGGSGYTNGSTITFANPNGGVAATATIAVTSGAITGVTITEFGTGYTTAPTSFTGGGGTGGVITCTIAATTAKKYLAVGNHNVQFYNLELANTAANNIMAVGPSNFRSAIVTNALSFTAGNTSGKIGVGEYSSNNFTIGNGSIATTVSMNPGNSFSAYAANAGNVVINATAPVGTIYFDQTTPGTTNSLSGLTLTAGGATLGNAVNTVSLTLTSGTLNDGGNTISVSGNVTGTASGVHTGYGQLKMTASNTSIGGNVTLGNLRLTNSTINASGNFTVANDLRMDRNGGGTLSLGTNTLTLGGNVVNYNTAGNNVFYITASTGGKLSMTGTSTQSIIYAVTLSSGGSGYTVNQTNTPFTILNPNGGVAAAGTFNTNSSGAVSSISLTEYGTGYTVANLPTSFVVTSTGLSGTSGTPAVIACSIAATTSKKYIALGAHNMVTNYLELANTTPNNKVAIAPGTSRSVTVNNGLTFTASNTSGKIVVGEVASNTLQLGGYTSATACTVSMNPANSISTAAAGAGNLYINATASVGTVYFDTTTRGTTNAPALLNNITGGCTIGNDVKLSGLTNTAGILTIAPGATVTLPTSITLGTGVIDASNNTAGIALVAATTIPASTFSPASIGILSVTNAAPTLSQAVSVTNSLALNATTAASYVFANGSNLSLVDGASIICNKTGTGRQALAQIPTTTANTTVNASYTGTVVDTIGIHSELPTVAAVKKLTIGNNGNILLPSNLTTAKNGALTLVVGKLVLGNYNLTLDSGSAVIDTTLTSYVYVNGTGRLIRNKLGTVASLFPIGTASSYAPLTLTNTAGSPNISVGVQTAISNAVADTSKIVKLQWSVTGGSGSNTADITYQFNGTDKASAFSTNANCEVGNYTTAYTKTSVGLPAGTNPYNVTATSQIIAASGTNLYVIGNTDAIYPSCVAGTYIGVTGGDANNPSNWCGGVVPTASTNVTISGTTPMLTTNLSVNNLALSSGLNLNGYNLTVNGTVSGTGAITGSATSGLAMLGTGTLYFDQTSPGDTNVLDTLIVNSSGTVALGNGLNVINLVKPTAGILASGGNLTLVSNAATGTARVAQGGVNGGYITGKVTQQLYIPAKTMRKSSFIGSSVTQRLDSAWQQQIYITGAGTGGTVCGTGGSQFNSNGFDKTQSNKPSMYTCQAVAVNGSRWVSVSNTNATLLSPGTGYSMNIRGDRKVGSCADQLNSYTPAAPVSVVLSATGLLTQGPVTVALNDTANYLYSLLANPYPCQMRFTAFQATNPAINNKMWTYSHYGNGNYTTYSNGLVTNAAAGYDDTKGDFIAIGQAFFVEANKTGTSITFRETHKIDSTIPNFNYFGTSNEQIIRMGLYSTTDTLLDEIAVRYNNQGSKDYTPNWDAESLSSGSQTLASSKPNYSLAISTRPFGLVQDTVTLLITSTQTGSFRLRFKQLTGFAAGSLLLKDKLVGTEQDITLNPIYDFTVTADTNSKGKGRFELIVNQATALPTTFTSLSGKLTNGATVLNWAVANEASIASYAVEHSTDGAVYSSIVSVKAIGKTAYTAMDPAPASGTNYYRIKAISTNGSIVYSNTVLVENSAVNNIYVKLYPSVVTSNQLNLYFSGMEAGAYTVVVYSMLGQAILKKGIDHAGHKTVHTIYLDKTKPAAGTYQIAILKDGKHISNATFVVE
ncbi:hypothetical protein [Parasediminibacterium sp. JCM 36343]|uniref:hypothetical protein n=1 Tax=Parasediminibacterium sp. JCM 36343 TaxID=3374279 RepID=UPI00397E2BFB